MGTPWGPRRQIFNTYGDARIRASDQQTMGMEGPRSASMYSLGLFSFAHLDHLEFWLQSGDLRVLWSMAYIYTHPVYCRLCMITDSELH